MKYYSETDTYSATWESNVVSAQKMIFPKSADM